MGRASCFFKFSFSSLHASALSLTPSLFNLLSIKKIENRVGGGEGEESVSVSRVRVDWRKMWEGKGDMCVRGEKEGREGART
jgi:hypothetical protein